MGDKHLARDPYVFDDPRASTASRKTNGLVRAEHLAGVIFESASGSEWYGADAGEKQESRERWDRIRDLRRGHLMALGRWTNGSEKYEQEVRNGLEDNLDGLTYEDAYQVGKILSKHNNVDYTGFACCTCA